MTDPTPQEVLSLQEEQADIKEANEVYETIKPQLKIEDGKNKIFFDLEGLKELTQKAEGVVLENDLLGLRVQIVSKKINADKLLGLAHGSMELLLKQTPTRVPLGVG